MRGLLAVRDTAKSNFTAAGYTTNRALTPSSFTQLARLSQLALIPTDLARNLLVHVHKHKVKATVGRCGIVLNHMRLARRKIEFTRARLVQEHLLDVLHVLYGEGRN